MASCAEATPYYLPVGDEVEIFLAAFESRLPVILKGPTGCGKTRFLEHMAHRIFRESGSKSQEVKQPLYSVSCHDDLSYTDLIGRFLFIDDTSTWIDGPLTSAVRNGGICYLDEVVEARKDTTVVIHSVTDHRRQLFIDQTSEAIDAHPDFLLVMSYNPGYQSLMKDLKTSTSQRFISIGFDYPDADRESEIILHESGVDNSTAQTLAKVGVHIRNLREHGFSQGVSTRLLIYAGRLMKQGINPRRAAEAALIKPLSDDEDIQQAITDIVNVIWP